MVIWGTTRTDTSKPLLTLVSLLPGITLPPERGQRHGRRHSVCDAKAGLPAQRHRHICLVHRRIHRCTNALDKPEQPVCDVRLRPVLIPFPWFFFLYFHSHVGSDVVPRHQSSGAGCVLWWPSASGLQGHAWQLEWVQQRSLTVLRLSFSRWTAAVVF